MTQRRTELEEKTSAWFTFGLLSELYKFGAISDEQARRSLDRLDSLEQSAPTLGQVGRYAAIGAAAGPAIGAIQDAIKGKALLGGATLPRGIAGAAVGGALSVGAIPLLRSHLDRRAEMGTIRGYLREHNEPVPAPAIEPAKVAFQTSQYSGPLSMGSFKMTSGLPAMRVPSLAAPVEKKAGLATTPAGLFASARAVGLPKVTSPGGSIAALAKPKGFGSALPGATNPNSLR